MTDKDKKQPKALRVTNETFDKFKDIAQDLGANQQQALARLIEVYEAEKSKESFPEQRGNIDTFEGYIRSAANMYMQALESVQNMRVLVRTEYDAQLKSKDKSIADLQERMEVSEKTAREVSEKESDYLRQIAELKKEIETIQKAFDEECEELKGKLRESNRTYIDLSNSYTQLQSSESETKAILSGFMEENKTLKAENKKYQEERQVIDKKMQDLIRENEGLVLSMEREKQKAEDEINRQKDIFEHYKANSKTEHQLELQIKINELQNSHKKELDEVRKELDKYKELYYQMRKDSSGKLEE